MVLQEIFGVNEHIRAVCATFADHGFVAVAPSFFDHFEHDVQLRYNPEGVARGLELVERLGFDRALQDVQATAAHSRARHVGGGYAGAARSPSRQHQVVDAA